MDQAKIGQFMRTLRQEKGITQEEAAEIFGVYGRTVSRWETGRNMPDISLLIEIADFYSVDIRELLDGERKENMQDNVNETAQKLEDYSKRKFMIIRRCVTVCSLLGLISVLILQVILNSKEYNAMALMKDILLFISFVAIALIFVISSGAINVFEKVYSRDNRKQHIFRIVLYSIGVLSVIGYIFEVIKNWV